MSDVLRLLPHFEWRGQRYPVTARSVSFQHEGAKHKIQYRDGEFVDQLGVQGLSFAYSIPMREDIAKGPYRQLFTIGLSQLFNDCHNRTPGQLRDPIYGVFRCVPMSFTDDTDVTKRDGTDVRVEFSLAPDFDAETPAVEPTGLSGIESQAGMLEEPYPASLMDPISAINSIGAKTLGVINKVSAKLSDLAFRLNKTQDTIDKLEDPSKWQTRNAVRSMRDATHRAQRQLNESPTVKIERFVNGTEKTVSVLARDAQMSVADLLALNPSLARSPIVPPGTPYSVRRKV